MRNPSPHRILVVEDDEAYREMLKLRLELAGYEVVAADDGLAGLNLARKAHPDLIILDLGLPEAGEPDATGGIRLDRRSGHKICRLMKFDRNLMKIPVLILTCSDSADDTALAVRAGADAYLMKTGDPKILLSEVRKLAYSRARLDAA